MLYISNSAGPETAGLLISVPPADENWRVDVTVLALRPAYRVDRHFDKPFNSGSSL